MPSRRQFLKASAALGALGVPRARADVAPEDRRFIFVTAYYGWDPTRVFAPEFQNPLVAMEADADPVTQGGLTWVAHPDRPSVDAFMETWGARTLLLNAVLVSSECLYRQFTGTSKNSAPDWPSILGHAAAARYVLPSVVVRGPSFPGPLATSVCRVGSSGQTAALLSGELVTWGDEPVRQFTPAAATAMDRYVAAATTRRALTAVAPRDIGMLDAHVAANRTATTLEGLVDQVAWGTSEDRSLAAQANIARDLLALGMARCVSLYHDRISWDSHAQNDPTQSANFEDLFSDLGYLLDQLDTTVGADGRLLSETTTVVVLSEMGRGPTLNIAGGKDHWPYTSMMIVGDGLTTDRVVGGFDGLYYGRPVDLASGEMDDGGADLTPGVVGATLLTLGGVDWQDWVVNDTVMDGVLV
jgi:hypothetical protein